MLNMLKPSLEEAYEFTSQLVCLDFIGKRGPTVGASREKRIQYAREVRCPKLCSFFQTVLLNAYDSFFLRKCCHILELNEDVKVEKLGLSGIWCTDCVWDS